jgi:hypothetical protein
MRNFLARNLRRFKATSNPEGSDGNARTLDFEQLNAAVDLLERLALEKDSLYDETMALRALAERVFGPQVPVDETSLHRTMFDLPLNPVEAIVQMALRRAVNARLMAGWYRDRLVFLIVSEKASSTLHEIVIRQMMAHTLGMRENFGIQRGLCYGPTEPATGAATHGLIPLYVPDGGVVRSPLLPYPGNARYLNDLGAKVILLTRHPADRIVARACMKPNKEAAAAFERELAEGRAFDQFFTQPSNASLRYDIQWMAGWLKQQRPAHFTMHCARYEDMVENPIAHFGRIHQFVTGKPMDAGFAKVIVDRMGRTKRGGDLQPGAVEGRTYPRGYSGEVGIWRKYFGEKDVTAYNDIIRRFLAYEVNAEQLLEIYPNLILDRENLVP